MSTRSNRKLANTMPPIRDFWQQQEQDGRNWITAPEKHDLVTSGRVFEAYAISEGVGQYGPQWIVDIMIAGQERSISFSKNDARDRFFEQFKTLIEQHGPTDVKLVRFVTNNGQRAYALGDPLTDYEDIGDELPAPRDEDDDVPF